MDTNDIPVAQVPVQICAAGSPPKTIDEHAGRRSTGDTAHSLAVMHSPAGWTEPAQTPEFVEQTVVISGELQVHIEGEVVTVGAGESITCRPGQRVRYETPVATNYVSLCRPAFSPDLVRREGIDADAKAASRAGRHDSRVQTS